MQKGLRQLLLLCGAVVILGGAYAGLTAWNHYSENKKEQEEKEEKEAAKIYLSQAENVDRIEVTNANGVFAFSYDSEGETWSYDKDDKFPLLQSKLTAITNKLKTLEAERELEGADTDLSVYGLEEPSMYLKFSEAEADEVVFEIGDSNKTSGDYYLKKSGEDRIYTVASSFINTLNWTEDDLLEKESFPSITSGNITELTWENGGETTVYRRQSRVVEETEEETSAGEAEKESSDSEEESTTETQEETVEETQEESSTEEQTQEPETELYWVQEKEDTENEFSDTEALDTQLTAVTGITFASCADYYMEDSEREQYGLDDAKKTVLTIRYTYIGEEKEAVLTIGSLTEDESGYYAVLGDSAMVNTVSKETVDSLRDFFETAGSDSEE